MTNKAFTIEMSNLIFSHEGFLANLTTDKFTGSVLLSISACCIMGNFYVAFKSSRDTQALAIAAAKKGNIHLQ